MGCRNMIGRRVAKQWLTDNTILSTMKSGSECWDYANLDVNNKNYILIIILKCIMNDIIEPKVKIFKIALMSKIEHLYEYHEIDMLIQR